MSEELPEVEEDGVHFRYRVRSRSEPGSYQVVDLTDRDGFGSCSCRDFETRANPNFKRIGRWIPFGPKREGKSDCWHLSARKRHFYLNVTVPMLASFAAGVGNSKK